MKPLSSSEWQTKTNWLLIKIHDKKHASISVHTATKISWRLNALPFRLHLSLSATDGCVFLTFVKKIKGFYV